MNRLIFLGVVFALAGCTSTMEITGSPANSDAMNMDSEPVCGDGVVDDGEHCDGDCPTACGASSACVTATLDGAAATCDARCVDAPVTACVSGDGCCPSGCGAGEDADCAPANNASKGNNGAGNQQANNSSSNNMAAGNNSSTGNSAENNSAQTNNTAAGNNSAAMNNSSAQEPMYENDCATGPLDAPIAGCRPTPFPTTGDPAEDCVRRINQFRWECQCLPPLERWRDGEMCADQQAEYDAQKGQAHAAFNDRICGGGFGQNECPGYGTWSAVINTCLVQMWDEGPGENFAEHGHYLNMTNPRFSKVACGEGSGWFVQNFQ